MASANNAGTLTNAAAVPVRHLAPGDGGRVRLESDAAHWTLSVQSADGRWLPLNSTRDPVAEADRLIAGAFAAGEPKSLIVIGLGLGYVLDAIERRSVHTKVLAIEPLPDTLPSMLRRRDWMAWTAQGRLTVLSGPDYRGASQAFMLLDRAPRVVTHPVLSRAFKEETAQALRLAARIIHGAQANEDARRRFAGPYLLNTLQNVPVICGEGDVAALENLFPGVPGVVIAAGPSLDRNIEEIRAVQDRALLIAVDTALRPLMAAGIRPHLVVAVDPQELNARHLAGITDADGICLVAEGSLHPSAFRSFSGRTFCFKVSNHHPWPWLGQYGADRGTLRAWGSVVTTAFDLACRVGCDPIVFAGADLAYTDGLLYCRNTVFERQWSHLPTDSERAEFLEPLLARKPTTNEPDIRGEAALSAPHFVQFRDWLVSRAREATPRRVVNATGAGILHGGPITQASLASISPGASRDIGQDLRCRLAEAWAETRSERYAVTRRMEQALSTEEGLAAAVDLWLEFAAGGATRSRVSACLDAMRMRLFLDGCVGEHASWQPGSSPPESAQTYWSTRGRSIERTEPAEPRRPECTSPDALASRLSALSVFREWLSGAPPQVTGPEREGAQESAASLRDRLEPILTAAIDASGPRARAVEGAAPDVVIQVTRTLGTGSPATIRIEAGRVSEERLLRAATGLLVRRHGDAPPCPVGGTSRITVHPLLPPPFEAGSITTPTGSRTAITIGYDVTGSKPAHAMLRGPEGVIGCIAPVALASAGSRRISHPQTVDERAIVVTVEHSTESLRIDAGGSTSAWWTWPGPVQGALPWGTNGGAVAWDDGTADPEHPASPCLWWRADASGEPKRAPLPFRPVRGVVLLDGRVAFACREGGLGTWSADGAMSHLFADMLFFGPIVQSLDGGGVLVARVERSARGICRTVDAASWSWDTVTDVLEPGPRHTVAGPMSDLARRGRWTAACHPFADVVRLRRDGGPAIDLTCHEPQYVAWAADSLVVATIGRDLLLFPNVTARIEGRA